jgi:hypothetical protein
LRKALHGLEDPGPCPFPYLCPGRDHNHHMTVGICHPL